MSFPSGSFFASVYQKNIPLPDGSTGSFTNFPLPSQSFFIGIPYIIGFVIAETPSNAADALYFYDRDLYNSINQVPGAIALLRTYNLPQGVSKKIALYGTDLSKDNTFEKEDESFPTSSLGPPPVINTITKGVMMYTSHGYFQYGIQLYYFSTLDDGTTLYGPLAGVSPVAGVAEQFFPAVGEPFITERNPFYENILGVEPFGPEFISIPNPLYQAARTIPAIAPIPGFPSISGITVNPDNANIYNVYRYFTDLKYGDVNLNTATKSFILGWSSSDLAGITGDYGADLALLSMYQESGIQQGNTLPVIYNYTVNSNTMIPGTNIKLISTIPSGRYYYIYDFVSEPLAKIQSYGIQVYYPVPPDSTSLQQTPVFTFITEFLQFITAENIAPGGTTTIVPNFGIGYPLNTYQITVNDATNSTRNSTLPYNYTPPPTVNTQTYTITINGSSDIYDTNTRTTQFIAYQYVANIAVANRVIESSLNFLTWTGGSLSSQFQYNSTTITTNGSLNFESGNKVDSGGLTAGVGYLIIPTNENERNPASGTYSTLYFDSITSNTLIIASASSLQRYTLTWQSFYKFNSPSPDGSRQYPVTLIGNGVTKTFTSLYNVVLVPFSEVIQNVPYTVKVLDITIDTDVYFFELPYDIIITPSRINFVNTISWTAFGNQPFNVQMGQNGQQYSFTSSSPTTQTLTENVIQQNGEFSFRPVGSTEDYIVASSYTLTANTISVTLPSSILVLSGATLSFDVGSYLYPADTYSLSLYRNGAVVQQLEASITNPFIWIPFKYTVTYQSGDQLYVKSNQHLNFGLSVPFTLIVNTPTNIRIVPNKINFTNTISWSVENNPVLNVRMGNYTFQSSSPYTENFTEDIINPSGNISFWAIGADPSRAVVASSYTLSAKTIFISLPSSMPIFSGIFFSYDIGSVLYRDDTYSMSLYRNGTVVQQLEAVVANPFTWFPYKYAATYQPGDQIYVKSNQHLNFGISQPFTFQVNASVTVDQSVYTIFSTIIATMTINADTDFTVRLNGATNIPVAFTQEGDQYTIQLKDYNLALGNYQLDFLLVNSPTIIVSSPSFLVTTSVTVDQPDYTIISTVNATVYVGVPTTFTVLLQDVDQLFPPIVLPSFTANLLSTYSFRLYGLPLTDANYVLQFTAGTVLTSPVFFISQSYFSFEELIIPTPPSRVTTNTLCATSKKNNLPTTIISIKNNIVYPTAIRGQRQYLVPCGILPYLKELTELLKTLSLRDALLFLIQKYNIPQNTPAVANKTRYQLPTANSKVLNPILQFTTSFRLSNKVLGNSVPISTAFVQKLSDARTLVLCNDDTKTFSTLYTDMLKNATYWLSRLAPFTKDGDYTFCVVRPIQGSLKQFITASITLKDNQLIFTPVILRVVLSFYEPYGAIDFSIMFTSPLLSEILKYLSAAYEKIYINPATAL